MTIRSKPNPYESPNISAGAARRRPRWTRNLVALNLALLLVPAVLGLIGYVTMRIEMAREAATLNGDIVTYDHEFVGFSAPALAFLAMYWLLPNAILICWNLACTVFGPSCGPSEDNERPRASTAELPPQDT